MEVMALSFFWFLVILQQHFIAPQLFRPRSHERLRLACLYSVCWLINDGIPRCPFVLPTVEHFRLLLPKGWGHYRGVGAGGGGSAAAGRGARGDPESALWPRSSFWLPMALPVRQVGWAVRWPAARCSEECRPDAFLHHRCTRDVTAAANVAHCGLEGR